MAHGNLIALGHAVRRARESRGLTQLSLAEHAGTDESTVTRIEKGRVAARVDTLWEIAAVLGVPLAQLITEADLDPETPT